MGGASLPPGFRFHPTDEELVGYYLQRKVEGLEIELEVIPVIDLYKFDPWELPEKSFLPKRDLEWFFFSPRDRKYPNGSRTNRATKAGYWKATGKDRKVVCQCQSTSPSTVTGYRKTLVFYRGRAPLGDRTGWVMHEYRICDDLGEGSPSFKGAFALCRVFKKNEKANDSPREQKGKSKSAAGSSSTSTIGNDTSMRFSNELFGLSISGGDISSQGSPVASPYSVAPVPEVGQASMDTTNPSSIWVSPDMIIDSSKDYLQAQDGVSEYSPQYDLPRGMATWQSLEPTEISPSSSHSNFNGEIEFADDLCRLGCMSPYSGQGNFLDFYENEDLIYEPYDQINSIRYP